jgi:uncharacterized membrane-anchored protein YhcB (DUF1043 family)
MDPDAITDLHCLNQIPDMRKFIITVIATLCLGAAMAQNPVSDALLLRNHFNASNNSLKRNDSVAGILKNYVVKESQSEAEDVFGEFNKDDEGTDHNPFIEISGSAQASMALKNLFTKGVGAISGVDVTTIADGLAKFIVQRVKQELTVAFFQDFKEKLEEPKYADLRKLFPQTATLLQTIDKNIYQFSQYMQALRENFIKDLNNLFTTFPQVINQPRYNKIFDDLKIQYLREILSCGLYITGSLRNGTNPGVMIENFPIDQDVPFDRATDQNLNGILKTIRLFSMSLRSPEANDNHYWISADSVWKMVKDPVALKIYMGLIYQGAKQDSIRFSDGKTLAGYLESIAPKVAEIEKYGQFVIDLIQRVQTLQQYVKELDGKPRADRTTTDYYNLFQNVVNVLKAGEDFIGIDSLRNKATAVYQKFIKATDNINNLYLDISRKNYSAAIFDLVALYNDLLKPAYEKMNGTVMSAVNGKEEPVALYPSFSEQLIKYGNFIATVAEAENSDDVAKAIDAVALPVGSASVKKHARFNIALNAYAGPFIGKQKMASDNEEVSATGIFSPVGIAFSKGFNVSQKKDRYMSVSLFVSLIDIGALTTFRFNKPNDTLGSNVQVKLGQIVAPGANLVIGVPRWPISLGFGGHFLPLLSKVEQDAITLADKKRFRWQAFLAVDIPILNFYNKSR